MIAKKMVTDIEAVRVTMIDRFSVVDQRLTTIEQLLYKIIDTQNQIVNPPEKGKKVVIGKADCGTSYESRVEIPLEGGNPYGWVGLYTNIESDFRQKSKPSFGFDYRPDEGTVNGLFVNNFVKADETGWDGKKSGNKTVKTQGKQVVKAGKQAIKADQPEVFKDSLKSNQWGTKEFSAKTDVLLQDSSKSEKCGKKNSVQNEITGKCDSSPVVKVSQVEIFKGSSKSDKLEIKESCAGSSGSCDKPAYKANADREKPDVSLQDSSKPDQCVKKDSGSCSKSVQNEVTGKCDKSRDWSKLVEEKYNSKDCWGPWSKNGDNKRKRDNSLVGGPNDGPSSSGPFTETKRRLDMFTSDEQEILNDIEPIMQSVRRILNPNEYNDGDPLSPDDQTFVLNNIFSHHPNKAQKIGAGIDYVMVSKHMKHQISRCFYVVSMDGRKEDFSYKKCLEKFLRGKYPDKAHKFIPKYFKPNQPPTRFPGNRDCGPYEAGTRRFRSGYKPGARRPGAPHQTKVGVGVGGTKQGVAVPWRKMTATRWGS